LRPRARRRAPRQCGVKRERPCAHARTAAAADQRIIGEREGSAGERPRRGAQRPAPRAAEPAARAARAGVPCPPLAAPTENGGPPGAFLLKGGPGSRPGNGPPPNDSGLTTQESDDARTRPAPPDPTPPQRAAPRPP